MDSSATTQTVVTIDGEQKPINFKNLNLDERMLDVNHFSFSWTPGGQDFGTDGPTIMGAGTPTQGPNPTKRMAAMAKFKKAHLSKDVIINFNDEDNNENYSFNGIITHIGASFSDHNHGEVDYQISGTGTFSKINGKIDCNSFVDKTMTDIFHAVVVGNLSSILKGIYTKSLKFTVQYNQTGFDFIKTLAIRFGQWMYYDGKNLVFGGKPSLSNPVKMIVGKDIQNLNVDSHITDPSDAATGFDPKKGKAITNQANVKAPSTSDLLTAAADAGEGVYQNNGTGTFYPFGQNIEDLTLHNKLQQQAAHASSVFLNGSSHNSKLSVGTAISVDDSVDSPGSTFIIVDIHHNANNNHGYSNHFTAIAADVEVPHYTNPWLFTLAKKQMAVVVENEQPDGLGGVKVHFPWMKAPETTDWIQVMTASGGKGQGFRWLPEKEEEVVIDFHGHNVEYPIMVSGLHTEQNKSGVDEKGNNIKMIGSKTGRRLEIDDDKGLLVLTDNFTDTHPTSFISLRRNDDAQYLKIHAEVNDKNYSGIALKNQDSLGIYLYSNGDNIVEIEMQKDGKKLTIKSMGSIDISADQDINISGANINIKAQQKLSLEGTQEVDIKGMEIKASADTNVEIEGKAELKLKGAMIEATGQAMAKIDGGGVAIIKGGVVMIN